MMAPVVCFRKCKSNDLGQTHDGNYSCLTHNNVLQIENRFTSELICVHFPIKADIPGRPLRSQMQAPSSWREKKGP